MELKDEQLILRLKVFWLALERENDLIAEFLSSTLSSRVRSELGFLFLLNDTMPQNFCCIGYEILQLERGFNWSLWL